MTILVLQKAQGHKMIIKPYEKEIAISLHCKESDRLASMSTVNCAVVASNEPFYTFGFVVEEDTCMVCRAGGTPRAADFLEITIPGPLYVEGGSYLPRSTSLFARKLIFYNSCNQYNHTGTYTHAYI